MVLSIIAFYLHIYLRILTFQGFLGFFLCVGGWSFWIASTGDFNRVIKFFSIMCPRKFSRFKKKYDFSGAAFIISVFNI